MELLVFLEKFYTELSEDARISATHVSLYMALIKQWNSTGCKNPFPVERKTIMQAAKISARFTYNKGMNNLQEFGYIKYLPASNSFVQSLVYLKSVEHIYAHCFTVGENDW